MVGILGVNGPRDQTTVRRLLLRGAAITSTVAAIIHFAVSGEHFQEYWGFGVFMLVAAWLQLAWAVGVAVRPSRPVLAAGAVLNAAVIAAYLVTRTVGDVIGPTPHEVEPVGFGDAFCTVCEALIVLAAVLLIARPLDRAVPRLRATGALSVAAALAAVLVSVSLLDGGPEMVMSMDSDTAGASAAQISLPTDSPAGPVRMPDPGMQMETGMKMAGATCTKTPTAAQQSATVRLVDTTWADARKYQSLAAAKAAGFRPVTPTGRPVVHYINPASYKSTVKGGPAIAPMAPQSLVYANTPHGAVLVAVMYIQSPRQSATPDPGGCLTQWHVHTNLCFARGAGVVGEMDPKCPAGSANRTSPPMLHIWFAPIPGGPTAVDATDAQVVLAAEQVASPHNATA
jgi:hypothetical protein